MRAVWDTNVLLSALISPHVSPHAIYCAWRTGRFELVTSKTQLDEIRRASRYPKFRMILQPHCVGTMINNMQRAIVLEPPPLLEGLETNDPDDVFLLAIALAGEVDYLVTGDHRAGLFQRGRVGSRTDRFSRDLLR